MRAAIWRSLNFASMPDREIMHVERFARKILFPRNALILDGAADPQSCAEGMRRIALGIADVEHGVRDPAVDVDAAGSPASVPPTRGVDGPSNVNKKS